MCINQNCGGVWPHYIISLLLLFIYCTIKKQQQRPLLILLLLYFNQYCSLVRCRRHRRLATTATIMPARKRVPPTIFFCLLYSSLSFFLSANVGTNEMLFRKIAKRETLIFFCTSPRRVRLIIVLYNKIYYTYELVNTYTYTQIIIIRKLGEQFWLLYNALKLI